MKLVHVLTFPARKAQFLATYANGIDPAQMSQKVVSDQVLFCLLTGICMQNTLLKSTYLNDKDRQIHWSKRVNCKVVLNVCAKSQVTVFTLNIRTP